MYKCSLGAAIGLTARPMPCNVLHSIVHLSPHITTTCVAAPVAIQCLVVALTAAACSVKAVFSMQPESQDVGQGQAVTMSRESLHKEQCTLHDTANHETHSKPGRPAPQPSVTPKERWKDARKPGGST